MKQEKPFIKATTQKGSANRTPWKHKEPKSAARYQPQLMSLLYPKEKFTKEKTFNNHAQKPARKGCREGSLSIRKRVASQQKLNLYL